MQKSVSGKKKNWGEKLALDVSGIKNVFPKQQTAMHVSVMF